MGVVRSSWSAWGDASSAVRAIHIATGCILKVGSSIPVSFWLRMPGHGGAGSRSRNGLFCVLGPGALVLSLCVFFVKDLLSSWSLGVGLVLALILAGLLLRELGLLVPRSLLPGLWVVVQDLG